MNLTTIILFRTEVRWMERWFRTILPQDEDTTFEGVEALPIASFIRDYLRHTPFGSNIGIRLASILLTLLCTFRYLRPFRNTTRAQRTRMLERLSKSKAYGLRECTTLLKLTAFLAWDARESVHRQLGVIGPMGPTPQWRTADDTP